jgi:hypothetical protein
MSEISHELKGRTKIVQQMYHLWWIVVFRCRNSSRVVCQGWDVVFRQTIVRKDTEGGRLGFGGDDGEAGRFLEGGVPASDTSPMKNPLFWGIESCTDDQFLSFQCM